jgi:SAM-dependent methyltransferase
MELGPPRGEGSCRSCPPDVEAFWAERARLSPGRGPARGRLVEAARALSDLFTTERPGSFPDYAADADALAAYGLYFFPRTWCQVRFPVAEAVELRGWRPAGKRARVLDLGSGPGAAGFSVARQLLARWVAESVHLVAVDRSAASLAALSDLVHAAPTLHGPLTVETRRGDLRDLDAALRPGDGPFDAIVAAHSMNEAFSEAPDADAVAWLRGLRARLAPGGFVLVVEPALRATSLRVRRVAAAACEGGTFFPKSPELGNEPWRPREDGRFWPHEVRSWTVPDGLARLNRTLRRNVRELSFSFALLGDVPGPVAAPVPNWFRLTSPIAKAKGRLVWTGLCADGQEHAFDALLRDVIDADSMHGYERGDVLDATNVEPLRGERSWRVLAPVALPFLSHPR